MYKKVVSAHQPNFMPYLGFFDKMQRSDIFVIRDEVLYVKKEYHNRNRIRINSHDNVNAPMSKWISVPVNDPKDYIMYAKIKKEGVQKGLPWHKQIIHDIHANYQKAQHYKRYLEELNRIFDNSDDDLISLNMKIIYFLKKAFGLKTEIVLASTLNLKPLHYEDSDGSQDIANICKAIGADAYLSGPGGKGYLTTTPFDKIGVKVEFQEYKHPVYPQCYPGFLPYMSAVDALFCVGQLPEDTKG